MSLRVVIFCAALCLTSALTADDKPGLKDGADLPGPFRPFHVANGKYEGRFHCPLCEHGLNPGVLVFVKNVDPANDARRKPLQALLKGLDTYIADNPKARLRATAVFLFDGLKDVVAEDDERAARAAELRKNKGDLTQVVLTLDSLPGLQKSNYDLDPTADVVVVLYDKLKTHKVFRSVSSEKESEAVLAEVKERLAPVKK